jgi:hypothetical protein
MFFPRNPPHEQTQRGLNDAILNEQIARGSNRRRFLNRFGFSALTVLP